MKGSVPTGSVTLTSSASFTILGALQDLTLTNSGSTAVNIASVTETDSGSPAYFTIASNTCGTSLAAQSSCTITVLSANSPTSTTQPATLTGALTVTDDAGTQTATLTSTDIYAIEVSVYPFYGPGPGIVSFPDTRVGSLKAGTEIYYTPWVSSAIAPPLPLTLSGADPSDFTATTYSPNPVFPGTTCSDDYGYNEKCEIVYSFKPTAAGLRSAKVSLDPSYGTPTGQYVLLQGTGVAGSSGFRTDISSLSLQSYLPGNIDPKSNGAAVITVTNIGITTLDLSASFTGAAAPYLTASVANCASVNPNATCQVIVNFSAPSVGSYSGSLTLTDVYGYSVSRPITATTSYWAAVAAPTLLSFGSVNVGSSSAAQNFVIADPNGYPLGHAYRVSLQPSSNFQLTQGSTCPASTTQTCTLSVAFAPQVGGAISEVASITDQTTGVQSQLALYGTGGAATYTLSTTGIVFPASVTGVASAPIIVTLTANGTQPISISSISIAGDPNSNFSQTNNCSTIAPASTCTINITFTPASAGTPTATLQIASNAVSSPTAVSLSGSGISASSGGALQLNPTSIFFPEIINGYTTHAQIVTVTNTASVPVTITSTPITQPTGATFAIGFNNCLGTLNAGGSCAIALTATSTVGGGAGKLVIDSTTPGSPQSVLLSGIGLGLAGTTATVSPSSFTYTIWGANKDYTVANTGTTPVGVSSSIGSDTTGAQESDHTYSTTYNGCSSELAAGSSCTFGVQSNLTMPVSSFPNGIGGLSGQLIVSYGNSGGSQTLSVASGYTSYLVQNGYTTGTIGFSGTSVGGAQSASIQLVNDASGSPAASLTIGGANPGDFSVSALEPSVSSTPSSSCPGTGTAPCTITVTFKPTAVGTRSAEISLDTSSTSTGQYLYVTGVAVPAGPLFSASPSASGGYTVTNTGTTTLDLGATITGANPGSFAADLSQCGSVAPQATCPVNITFNGNLAGNNYTASLLLYDQSSSASTTVILSSTVSSQSPSIGLGGDTPYGVIYTFADQPVNTIGPSVSFTVNGYGDPLTLSVGSTNFTITSASSCAASGQPSVFSVAFLPAATGTLSTSLTATDTVTGKQTSITLSGTAQ